ncbi:MAG: HlyC/CorC family transporter [Magnetospirillum sp. WYHS-4]
MITTIVIIAVCLILSAFFSAAETALTAASRPLMHHMEKGGDVRATMVNQLCGRRARLISTILFGSNLINIFASALATDALIMAFGDAGIAYATLVMTFLVLIFTDIMPKVYAFRHASRVALVVAPLTRVLVAIFLPFTKAIDAFVRGVFRLFGVDVQADAAFVQSEEELRGAIELHQGEHPEIKHEKAMLKSVLDLGDVWVSEVMTHRKDMVAIDAEAPPDVIVDQVAACPFTRIPLYRGSPDEIVGVIHAKDLLRVVRSRGGMVTNQDINALAAKPWFVPEATTLFDQLQAFRRRREHIAMVVDEYGSLLGLVTLEDILEDIVGDIADEHDVAVPGVRPAADGSYTVHGTVTVRDLNRKFEWSLPDEPASTVAGLVMHEARRIPEQGQVFLFHGFRFEIMRRERHQITLVRITPPRSGDDGA